jgi:hypothetical protein
MPLLTQACYMPRLLHSPWLDHSNHIWRRVNFMKLLLVQFSPTLFRFATFRTWRLDSLNSSRIGERSTDTCKGIYSVGIVTLQGRTLLNTDFFLQLISKTSYVWWQVMSRIKALHNQWSTWGLVGSLARDFLNKITSLLVIYNRYQDSYWETDSRSVGQ